MSEKDQVMTVISVPVAELHIPEIQMREVVKDNPDYVALKNSIQEFGLINAVTVIPIDPKVYPTAAKDGKKYTLICGFHRTSAMIDLGWMLIPCSVDQPLDTGGMLFRQLIENYNTIPVKPMDCSRQLKRILAEPQFQALTIPEILQKIGLKKSRAWVDSYLRLGKLHPDLHDTVNNGHINISNARILATLPMDLQKEYKDAAIQSQIGDFKVLVDAKLEEIKAKAKGEPVKRDPFAGAKMRKAAEIKRAVSNLMAGNIPVSNKYYEEPIAALGIKDKALVEKIQDVVLRFGAECIAWCIEMDSVSVDNREAAKKRSAEQREKDKEVREQNMDMIKNLQNDPEMAAKLQETLAALMAKK